MLRHDREGIDRARHAAVHSYEPVPSQRYEAEVIRTTGKIARKAALGEHGPGAQAGSSPNCQAHTLVTVVLVTIEGRAMPGHKMVAPILTTRAHLAQPIALRLPARVHLAL
eukprot:CAMPEP_0180682916 /NCGR_PEP_ID=MMETSP1037_2-20121125/70830_1 /TAXON_ID=632150 /ORGANISM="Azadinium spinosum, Strain 3D9" /LENGTH=110 /DNA_ID=CAMNT_0022712977 /DNA_START=465 /DNA_END=798 /DNA_ORIENTATION=+